MNDLNATLAMRCETSRRYKGKYQERLEEELTHIKQQELVAYYLALQEKGFKAQTNRHLVAYLMGLTDEFNGGLPPLMGDMPDIDVDFSDRGTVVEYLKEKYGWDHVAYISNYTHLSGKSALNDIARVTEVIIPKKVRDEVEELGSIKKFLARDPELPDDILEALRIGANLEGNIRQFGITAAGVVVSSEPITNYAALYTSKDKIGVPVDKRVAEAIGFIKMDVLYTTNVAAIQRCIQLIEDRGGTPPENVWDLPMDDEKMIKEFAKANTDLIFQYGGYAAKALLPRMKPKNVNDIIAVNALCRKGADDAAYIRRKEGKEEPNYFHPVLKDVLGETYGVMVYQEQVMAICRQLAGMYWQDVNRVRKMVAKKTYKEEPELKGLFMRGCHKNGITEKQANYLWSEIKKHGEYSFNKAHCVAYFLVAWVNMYLQVYHPFEWYLANMELEKDEKSLGIIIMYAQKAGINIESANVNRSKATWSYDGDTLIAPLSNIRGVGFKTAEKIMREAQKSPVIGWDTDVFRPGLKTEHTYYYLTQEGYDPDNSYKGCKIDLPKNAFEALKEAGAIPGIEGDAVRSKIAAGLPVDVTEGKTVHKWWSPVPLGKIKPGPCVVHGYVKSAAKRGGSYELNIQSDIPGNLWYHEQLEPGSYLLVTDGKWERVYYAVPEEKWETHPMMLYPKDGLQATWGPGVAFITSGTKINTSYITMILGPQPRTVWLNKEMPRGWYKFKYSRELKGWQTKLLRRA